AARPAARRRPSAGADQSPSAGRSKRALPLGGLSQCSAVACERAGPERWATRSPLVGGHRAPGRRVPRAAAGFAGRDLAAVGRLPAGSYNVIVSAPGYLPTRLTVELLPGVTTVVAASLLPETAGLLYVAARPWATVFIDGDPIGYTSVAAHRLVSGRHVLRLEY